MTKVLYHKNCNDGYGSALCAWTFFGDSATYIPVGYGESFPRIEPGEDVYILDFSYPKEVLLNLKTTNSVVVLDHHKTAQEDLKDLDFCIFDMSKSGAMLSWDYFSKKALKEISDAPFGGYPDDKWDAFVKIKPLIEYVQDRDLYLNKLPNTEEVFYALASLPQDFKVWSNIGVDELFIEGKAIRRHVGQLISRALKQVRFVDKFSMFGYDFVPIVNSSVYETDVCMAILDKYPEANISGCFYQMKDGKFKWSLRSRSPYHDVSVICKALGGGGHPQASGFIEEYNGKFL